MKGADGSVLYVGKAKNIKKRVSSYFHKKAHDNKTQALVSQIEDIEVTIAANEMEALLLENSLINKLKPPYNVIFRDDKSYPYLAVSDHVYPRLFLHRGEKKNGFKYFGPYPNVREVRETVETLHRVFQIRQCEDSYFSNRDRPCLQYQIDRCSAPCVKKISKDDYRCDIKSAELFLKGKSGEVVDILVEQMEESAQELNFEKAAKIRNQIQSLRSMNQYQRVFANSEKNDSDVIGYSITKDYVCFHILVIRNGVISASRQHLNKLSLDIPIEDIFTQFILQNYIVDVSSMHPKVILLPKDIKLPEPILKKVTNNIQIRNVKSSYEYEWESMARSSAHHAIKSKMQQDQSYIEKLKLLAEAVSVEYINKIVCFDISHLQGTNTIASCVVYGINGAIKKEYRRLKINPKVGGDDYFSIYDAVKRYLSKALELKSYIPEVLLIDGGEGQVSSAKKALSELDLDSEIIKLIGISKGPERKAGEERILFEGTCLEKSILKPSSPAFLLLQEVRDEAHRFAITGHRKMRENDQTKSFLEGISGIGPKKRQDLLKYFGGLHGVMKASALELSQVPGISKKLAERLFSELHSDIK